MKFNWPCDSIWEQINPLWPDISIEVIPTIDSTNTQLLHRIRNGQTQPTILVAEEQTNGRGRAGRPWSAQAGDSLTFSLALPMPANLNDGLSLAVGCAIAHALDPEQHFLQIKWPNDIWFKPPATAQNQTTQTATQLRTSSWHKLAGILIETASYQRQHFVVIGVGINIHSPCSKNFTPNHIPAGYLTQISHYWNAPLALACTAPQIAQAVYNFAHYSLSSWQTLFSQRDLLAGQALHTSDGLHGIGAGIDSHGHLLIQTPEGIKTIHSGEVSVRPC